MGNVLLNKDDLKQAFEEQEQSTSTPPSSQILKTKRKSSKQNIMPKKQPETEQDSQPKTSEAGQQVDTGGIDPSSQRVILTIKAVFPFQFFPDEVVVDEMKVTYINNIFFLSKQIRSIMINNIAEVLIETGPFFSSLIIRENDPKEHQIRVTFLKTAEAVRARQVIQGLIISRAQAINLDEISHTKMIKDVEKLGTVQSTTAESDLM